ncbi:hypothetical protein GOP56_07790 [Brevibacillus sp. 7WMA2]|uniref:hypothetical protein n=1 Tax=Brevibacillus sp. 7WMA2 TaxID=2683193 RepID=UPI0013A7199E|nr:hypothetical protein [Brevibacillus sp. 7WMA2]QIC05499.1 hypothetical protein GOP56_07790 [Brevibacillus sp. 7WMA2]WPS86340.1 hypothetical protein SMD22_17735 [Brevibacillus halotolerans]
MDTIEDISLSRIATIISKNSIIRTVNNTKWDRVLSNAGQSELFNKYNYALTPSFFNHYNGRDYENDNPRFSEFYSAIKAILKTVYNHGKNSEAFTKLIGTIIEEIDIMDVLNEEVAENLRGNDWIYENPLEEIFKGCSNDQCLEKINKEAKKDYHELVHNLHVLNLDISYSNYQLVLRPFTHQGASELNRNPSLLMDWLETEFPIVAKSYKDALEAYVKGLSVSCIANCRNIITGIFDNSKDDETRWLKGLQKLSTDTYIENVSSPRHIIDNVAKKELGLVNVDFKYSRFRTIYQLYSLSSDLGPHINEGPMIEGVHYPEKATMNDALWILRMTEDLLIWIKEVKAGR